MTNTFAAVDLGASSGRVMTARVGPEELALHEVHRFPNRPLRTGGTLHWDVLGLYAGILDGLRAAGRARGRRAGLGMDRGGGGVRRPPPGSHRGSPARGDTSPRGFGRVVRRAPRGTSPAAART